MDIKHIDGFTRVIGESQGYIGLPLRDITLDDTVTGPGTPAMESAWKPDIADIEAIQGGASIVLRVVGEVHPPVALYVEKRAAATETQNDLHNRMAGEVVQTLIRAVFESGGGWPEVMVITESVLVGVALAGVKLGRDETMLDLMVSRARERLAELRLTDLEPVGSA